jgi:nitroreductase
MRDAPRGARIDRGDEARTPRRAHCRDRRPARGDAANIEEIDHLLTTTKSVRRRLDLVRPVPREVLRACVEVACYAPNASNAQEWHWIVVDDPALRARVAEQYRAVTVPPVTQMLETKRAIGDDAGARISASILWLAEHLCDVPVIVFPCYDIAAAEARYRALIPDPALRDRGGIETHEMTPGMFASILPAVWNFQLALRSRGLGSVLTTAHQADQPAMAEILGIPHSWYQTALLPVAYAAGDFTRSPRKPVDDVIIWNDAGRTR